EVVGCRTYDRGIRFSYDVEAQERCEGDRLARGQGDEMAHGLHRLVPTRGAEDIGDPFFDLVAEGGVVRHVVEGQDDDGAYALHRRLGRNFHLYPLAAACHGHGEREQDPFEPEVAHRDYPPFHSDIPLDTFAFATQEQCPLSTCRI